MMTPKRFGIRDAKRPNRERETLISEITRLVNRMKACLVGFGVRGFDPILRKAADRLEKLITPERVRLPPLTPAEMLRHGAATLSWRTNPIDRESPCHALIVLWRIVTTGAVPAGLWRGRRFLKQMSGLSRRRSRVEPRRSRHDFKHLALGIEPQKSELLTRAIY